MACAVLKKMGDVGGGRAMKSWKPQSGVVLALVLLPLSGIAAAAADALPAIEAASTPVQEKKSRLKFKRGPTCMCVRGTSEEEIRQAEERRHAGEKK
jgi:hypothetical protein